MKKNKWIIGLVTLITIGALMVFEKLVPVQSLLWGTIFVGIAVMIIVLFSKRKKSSRIKENPVSIQFLDD
ncbi:MAG: hypothetical protein U9R05_10000 [Chloroflexota bacterium]|nr:hypothetical protein [Chloroflexota bacterium]